MVDPKLALGVAVVLGATSFLLFRPVHGLLWRWSRAFRATDRVQVEDALKHIHDFDYRGQPCTLQSLSGALELTGDRSAAMLDRLARLELITSAEGAYELTPEGRRYALRVIRIHRLWERYLSDETGLSEAEWHTEAEYREHLTSPAEAEALAARMNHPRWDPHGDPIPSADGEIAASQGLLLTELAEGVPAEIIHVEDEPQAVYAQLVAERLHLGVRVRVLESSPERIRIEADGEEHLLAPVVAANLTVAELSEDEGAVGPFSKLSEVELGEKATVVGIGAGCRGAERRRILDLGFIPGTVVEPELRSPGGDPTGYRVRGSVIALRNEQADQIRVDRAAVEVTA